jgi:probable DNA metabolism protein
MGPKVNLYRSHPDVYPIHKLDRQVRGEAHRFFGLLRFADTGKFLYAGFSPDHNILTLIADHFADRLRNERWIIHDQKRHLAVIYNGPEPDQDLSSKWYLTDLDNQWQKAFTQEEEHWQELWRLYFHHISIKSRYNPRLQSQLVPLRYRRHLVEFQSSFGDNVTFI